MTNEEAIAIIENEKKCVNRANKNDYCNRDCYNCELVKTDTEILTALDLAIKALEQEPCDDAISYVGRLIDLANAIENDDSGYWTNDRISTVLRNTASLSPVTPKQKYGKCKDCKWWRDSDGAYRRGVKAESRCPINTVSVANGFGYCYMFEPQESEG